MKGRGENLAMNTMPDEEAVIKDGMKAWYDEESTYDYSQKSCAPWSCHYTQVSTYYLTFRLL